MKDQLEKLMKAEGLSPAKFADEIGVQRSSISHILSGRNKPSFDFITKILDRFQGINAEWLLTGKGNMIKGLDQPQKANDRAESLFEFSNTQDDELKDTGLKESDKEKEHSGSTKKETSYKDTIVNKGESNKKFTDVNDVDYILVFYKDGSFRQYNARD